jgi:signal transduction histidine kinase
MTLRQQQAVVFLSTVTAIFGIFAAGGWLIAQRLTTEATLQTALVMARQVEIALADSLRERPVPRPRIIQQPSSSFWGFLGNIFPDTAPKPIVVPGRPPSRQTEVKGLIKAFVDRSGGIRAMWVINADGAVLYSSAGDPKSEPPLDPQLRAGLKRGVTHIDARTEGEATYYDVLVPLQMPRGVAGPGGLRLWINPADWKDMLAGLWRQLTLLFALGGAVALLSAFLTTALYTRRFRVISDALRQAEAGTYAARPHYAPHDEIGASLDLIDRLVMKQRQSGGATPPLQRLALAARTLAHEVRTPLNALAIHLELLRNGTPPSAQAGDEQTERAYAAAESSIRQVSQLIRDFSDYSAPVTMDRKLVNVATVLAESLAAIAAPCAAHGIVVTRELAPGPWMIQGDATRLRQLFDNLLINAVEAQPDGGAIRITAQRDGSQLILRFVDNGPGIPLQQRGELFEFGKTTKAGGSGIGLPLSELIAEAHGGSLVLEESEGGAAFRVTLSLEVH